MKYIPTELKKEIKIDNVVSVHYHEYTPDFAYSGESHDFYEMIYCDKGVLRIISGETERLLLPSQAYIHPKGQYHNVRAENGEAASSIVFSFNSSSECLAEVSDRIIDCDAHARGFLASILKESKSSFDNIQELVFDSQLIRKKTSSAFASEQALGCYIELLFIHLVRLSDGACSVGASEIEQKNELLVKTVCDYMRENLEKKLTFDDIVAVSLVSPTTLKQIFKRTFGHGAMEHLSILRTERAKELLRKERYSCTEIASMCGFFSIHHFCRVFKKRYGMPPTDYVKTVKSRFEFPSE